nr:uncharacterized protein LOC112937996 isoform X1 [Oryza sativa Japonica Group]
MSQLILGVFGSALFERSACSRSHGVGGFRAPGLRRCGSTADRAGGSGSRQRRQRWRRSFPVDRGGGSGSRRRRRRRQWRLRLRGVIHHGLRQRWLGVLLQSSSRLQLPPRLFLLSAADGGTGGRRLPAWWPTGEVLRRTLHRQQQTWTWRIPWMVEACECPNKGFGY